MRDWLAFFLFNNGLAPKRVRRWAEGRIAGWYR